MADLLDVATVARHLGIPDEGPEYDVLDALINVAQKVIERVTWRSLATATAYAENHDGGRDFIYVRRPPILSITTLEDSAWAKGSNAARAISSDDWIADTDDGGRNYAVGKVQLCNDESSFGGTRNDVHINYVGGWSTGTIPADLKQAWIELVRVLYDDPSRTGADSANLSLTTADWVPKGILQVLLSYSLKV